MEYISPTAEEAKALALVPLRKILLASTAAVDRVPAGLLRIIENEEINKMKSC